MPFTEPPTTAAWQHTGLRSGFEVVYFHLHNHGYRIDGCTTAIEGGQTWAVGYDISVDAHWLTRSVDICGRSSSGSRTLRLDADGSGRWLIDGNDAPHLDGCLDVDLESSAATNTLPVHRLDLAVGPRAEVPAAYIRSLDLAVERLEQTYLRTTRDGAQQEYDYTAPAVDFACRLGYDESGLVLDYPGIAVRAR